MLGNVERATARQEILATLAADTGADALAFAGDGITVVEWRELPGRRRFPARGKPFQMITTGHGLVVSCHRDWLDQTRELAEPLDRFRFVAPANIAAIVALLQPAGYGLTGPQSSYGCSVDTLRDSAPPRGVALDTVSGPALEALRPLDAFPNALSARPDYLRPDMLAVTARAGREVVACAAASADSDRLWQIGVDVLPPWRGRGIGRVVVGRLTQAILDAGKVPYYSHSVSNVPSAALATSLGYWPAWVQWHARESR
jgi:GNAT superfamily N-acetyltransferase